MVRGESATVQEEGFTVKGLVPRRGAQGTVASPYWEMFGGRLWPLQPTKPCRPVCRAWAFCWAG